jgi:hypothetical protein
LRFCLLQRVGRSSLFTCHVANESVRHSNRAAVQPPKIAVQLSISTIPCKIFYLLANPMLTCHMFSSQFSQSSSPSPDFFGFPLTSVHSVPSVLKSTRTSTTQRSYPRPARHREIPIETKSFTIRSSTKRACNPCRMRSFKTQDLKPFRIRIYEKTGGRGPIPQASSVGQPILAVLFEASPVRVKDHRSQVPPHLFRTPNEVN